MKNGLLKISKIACLKHLRRRHNTDARTADVGNYNLPDNHIFSVGHTDGVDLLHYVENQLLWNGRGGLNGDSPARFGLNGGCNGADGMGTLVPRVLLTSLAGVTFYLLYLTHSAKGYGQFATLGANDAGELSCRIIHIYHHSSHIIP